MHTKKTKQIIIIKTSINATCHISWNSFFGGSSKEKPLSSKITWPHLLADSLMGQNWNTRGLHRQRINCAMWVPKRSSALCKLIFNPMDIWMKHNLCELFKKICRISQKLQKACFCRVEPLWTLWGGIICSYYISSMWVMLESIFETSVNSHQVVWKN